MKMVLVIVYCLCVFSVANAKTDFTSPEYKQVIRILELPDKAITIPRIDIVIINALMETNRIWEANIFGHIRHGLKSKNIKYSVKLYLSLQLADIFFHQNDVFSYKGQTFSITDNTRKLALDSFWDLANTQIEAKHIFDIIERRMFEVTQMSLSNKKSDLEKAAEFLKHSAKFINNNKTNTHYELFALGLKNKLFNIFSSTDSEKVRSATYEIISSVIKNGSSLKLVSNEYKKTLQDFSNSFAHYSCRNLWK